MNHNLVKTSFIKRLDNKYRVYSESGKNLGTYDSLEDAKKRLRQIEYFKNKKASKSLDISKADDFTYSAMIRFFRKNLDKKDLNKFLEKYKINFEKLYLDDSEDIEKSALKNTLLELKEDLDLDLNIKKEAQDKLGSPEEVGKYLANIVKFTLRRIKPESRPMALLKLKRKIFLLNENEIAQKKMPASSSMGNSITFIKHILFNHNASYVREVLNNIARNI